MTAPTFDLQSHSTFSDGALPPAEVVRHAAAAGVELLALTDHDTVDGVEAALQAAASAGITVVPAVELSAVDGDQQDLHILGYRIDHRQPSLLDRLRSFREDRERRADAMVEAIEGLGYAVDRERLAARRAEGRPIGRPNIADAVVSMPGNRERLLAEGLAERSAFLVAYLIEGKAAFRLRAYPTVEDAIGVIHAAGGLAVWAHPFWDIPDSGDVLARIDRFVTWGLDGVEAFYPAHSSEQTRLLVDRCTQLDLLSTGSSDFHGPNHREFSRFRAFSTVDRTPNLGPIAQLGGGRLS